MRNEWNIHEFPQYTRSSAIYMKFRNMHAHYRLRVCRVYKFTLKNVIFFSLVFESISFFLNVYIIFINDFINIALFIELSAGRKTECAYWIDTFMYDSTFVVKINYQKMFTHFLISALKLTICLKFPSSFLPLWKPCKNSFFF